MGDNLRSSSVGDFIGDLDIHRKEERLAHEHSGDLASSKGKLRKGAFFFLAGWRGTYNIDTSVSGDGDNRVKGSEIDTYEVKGQQL